MRLMTNRWAQGWTEVFPELTEDERRLPELPGLTAEQRETFILRHPAIAGDVEQRSGAPPPPNGRSSRT